LLRGVGFLTFVVLETVGTPSASLPPSTTINRASGRLTTSLRIETQRGEGKGGRSGLGGNGLREADATR